MAQQTILNGQSGLVVRNALNAMFAELYAAIVTPIKLAGVSVNATQAIPANTFIQDIALTATSGSPTIRLGTTPNGTDIMPDTVIGNSQIVETLLYCQNLTTIYISHSGSGTVSLRFDVLYNYY